MISVVQHCNLEFDLHGNDEMIQIHHSGLFDINVKVQGLIYHEFMKVMYLMARVNSIHQIYINDSRFSKYFEILNDRVSEINEDIIDYIMKSASYDPDYIEDRYSEIHHKTNNIVELSENLLRNIIHSNPEKTTKERYNEAYKIFGMINAMICKFIVEINRCLIDNKSVGLVIRENKDVTSGVTHMINFYSKI